MNETNKETRKKQRNRETERQRNRETKKQRKRKMKAKKLKDKRVICISYSTNLKGVRRWLDESAAVHGFHDNPANPVQPPIVIHQEQREELITVSVTRQVIPVQLTCRDEAGHFISISIKRFISNFNTTAQHSKQFFARFLYGAGEHLHLDRRTVVHS